MNKNILKIVIVISLLLMLIYFFLSFIHINYGCNHEDNCPICLLIHKVKRNILGFKKINTIIFIFIFIKSIFNLTKIVFKKNENTLIYLKVQLNN